MPRRTTCKRVGQPQAQPLVAEALWRSAIGHLYKCFEKSAARVKLLPGDVFGHEPPLASQVYEHFKALRDKHFFHDENSWSQCTPGAVLNKPGEERKVAAVLCCSAAGMTRDEKSIANVRLLVEKSLTWVTSRFDSICETLRQETEKEPYESLIARDGVAYRAPAAQEVSKNRNAP
jgi:hypothetical protein